MYSLKIEKLKSSKGKEYYRYSVVIDGLSIPVQLDYVSRNLIEQLIKDK